MEIFQELCAWSGRRGAADAKRRDGRSVFLRTGISGCLLMLGMTAVPLDINTATREQLRALPGMGYAYADRVIRARPYSRKNQLIQRGILPVEEYGRIKDLIVARRPQR